MAGTSFNFFRDFNAMLVDFRKYRDRKNDSRAIQLRKQHLELFYI